MQRKIQSVLILSKIGYTIGAIVLYVFAIWIIVASVFSVFHDFMQNTFKIYQILDEVGLLVFSIAVIDVAKYLVIEEVIKNTHHRAPAEERDNLTRVVIIIATALALEGLVLTIEVAKTQLNQLLYPILLLLVAAIFIVSIGVYQKLNSSTD